MQGFVTSFFGCLAALLLLNFVAPLVVIKKQQNDNGPDRAG
jgi:hypothetical protein